VIQVLCSHRHGSNLYCNYTKSKHDLKFVRVYDSVSGKFGNRSSFFSMEYKIDGSNNIKYKLDYLKCKKTQGVHYFMKIMPQIFYESSLNNLLEYINDYEVHILNRNPWDVFLSYSYQSLQQFKIAHRLRDCENNLAPVETEFLITDDLLSHWLQEYSKYKSSVKWLCDNGTFKYKVIDYDMFKDIEVFKTLPMGLNYKKLCLNYDEMKNKFSFPGDINSIL
jgi:hypothetical protein